MRSQVAIDDVVVAVPSHLSADLGGESIVLELGKELYYSFDQVATRVWSLILEPRRVSDVRDVITAEFDVDAATCEKDLVSFIGSLAGHGLVEVVPDDEGPTP